MTIYMDCYAWPRCGKWVGPGYITKGGIVAAVQQMLVLQYYPGSCPVDGYYGPKTEAAIKWWQQQKGLTVDGIVGPNTWRSLSSLLEVAGDTGKYTEYTWSWFNYYPIFRYWHLQGFEPNAWSFVWIDKQVSYWMSNDFSQDLG